MNVLVSSISKKIPMLQAVKDAASRFNTEAKVHGMDTDADCFGRYFVEGFWHAPFLRDIPVELLIYYCQNQDISIIFPSRDGELPISPSIVRDK
ncbi:carbamoyl phosphate synthase-like protein [compost metagenome]